MDIEYIFSVNDNVFLQFFKRILKQLVYFFQCVNLITILYFTSHFKFLNKNKVITHFVIIQSNLNGKFINLKIYNKNRRRINLAFNFWTMVIKMLLKFKKCKRIKR